MSKPNARIRHLPPSRRERACASATGIATVITTTTGITSPVRSVVFV
ncbi:MULTISPECIES: hypothetical protein [Pseudoxanthomonas]|nr:MULTISPECIES: hypothetical protein [Pseudoxanthomonas]MCR6684802.1 hypothetical protein [Pseudoxanthomonas sp.]